MGLTDGRHSRSGYPCAGVRLGGKPPGAEAAHLWPPGAAAVLPPDSQRPSAVPMAIDGKHKTLHETSGGSQLPK